VQYDVALLQASREDPDNLSPGKKRGIVDGGFPGFTKLFSMAGTSLPDSKRGMEFTDNQLEGGAS
jgi:hypothetical protein